MKTECDDQSSQAEAEVQLALRLARIRAAKRRNYVRIVAKHAALLFISNNKKNVSGTDNITDNIASVSIASVKQAQDKKLLQSYFNEILQDTGKYGFIVHDTIDTIYALEKGALDLVIVWEHLPINRVVLRNSATRELTIVHLTPEEEEEKEEKEKHGTYCYNGDTWGAFEVILRVPLVEWLAHACKRYSIQLQIVDDMTPEGSRFCREFGGIGGVLHENNGLGDLVTGIALDVDADAFDT